MPAPELFLGLISGTSADGIDAALVSFDGAPALRFGRTYPWEADLREALVALGQAAAPFDFDRFGALDHRIGAAFAQAAQQAIEDAGLTPAAVRAIGSHGQTLRHRPTGPHPFTLQLGDPNLIAERTGCITVADFRRRDMAAGGHGAPLMPGFHAAVLAAPDEARAVLNLGGIANLTLLPPQGPIRGFDTGPANALLDAWCHAHTGAAFDRDGAFAAQGRTDAALLARLLAEPWFALPPPKSTGRDQFHLAWLRERLRGEAPADVQATLVELTAATVCDALRLAAPDVVRVIACGGGVHNARLLAALRARLPGGRVESSAAYGIDPDFVEAMGFAWLARETLAGRAGNRPGVTGARGPRVLGAIYAGQPAQ